MLAALLADDEADDVAREGSNLAMLAIAVDDAFSGRAARMASYIRSSPPIDAARPVMMPGEREQREAATVGGRTGSGRRSDLGGDGGEGGGPDRRAGGAGGLVVVLTGPENAEIWFPTPIDWREGTSGPATGR